MAKELLYCAGCNANFKAKSYDPKKTYPCPKCKQPLKLKGEADASASGVALDTEGKIQTDRTSDALVGQKIAQYKVTKKLGQGGMGAVYEAKHLELGRTVALKLLSPKLVEDDPDSVERFKREARSAAVLNHPNVVAIHYVGSEGPHHFIEQEYVDGESVHERVTREGKLALAEATRIVADAAKALGAAHKQNIVHRDIKPGNIMLSKDGQVKVMDFGLAKDVAAPTQLTVSGHIMGTPHYMSPEQCDGQRLDGRSDIYALGATYYAILAGKTPYQGTSLFAVLRQQVEAPVPDVREKCPELPESVQRVIEKAMAKAPEDRFQTAEELVAALDQVGSAPSEPTATVSTPAPASGSATAGATLDDVMDADEERESHLHTARIRGRIKEVEAFLGTWKDLAKAAAASRKKGQASEAEEAEFTKLRSIVHKQYAGILRRLGNPGAPGQRVVSACETGVTLSSIVQMADADFRDLSCHFQTGAKLLFDYVGFLEDGRQDLLKQSTLYFYWDKVMHNSTAAAIAGTAAVMLLSLIGWQVVKHLPKGKLTPRKEVAQEASTTEDQTSDDAPAEIPAPARTAATGPSAPAARPAPSEEADLMALEPAYPGFFPIGVWALSIDPKQFEADKDAELSRIKQEMELMKSIGINTVVSGVYAPDGKPHTAIIAKELGVRVVGTSSGLWQIHGSEQPVDRSEVQQTVARDAEGLKAHPNLFGYLVWLGDPKPHFTPDMWKQMAEAAMESDPTRPPHFVYSGTERAAAYWAAHPLPSIYTHIYPFSQGGTSAWAFQKAIRHFRSFHRLAPNASHFAFLQAVGERKPYRTPTKAELRGLSNLALAHGAKGIFFFCWRYPAGVGLTDGNGQLTEFASEVERLSQTVGKIGPVLLRLRLGPSLATVEGNALATTLVSEADHQYAFVVNLDVEKSTQVKVTVKPTAGKSLAGVRDVLAGEAVEAEVTDSNLTFVARLESGEGRLFRILHRPGGPPRATGRVPADITWAAGPNPPVPRWSVALGALEGLIVCAGGRASDTSDGTETSALDVATGKWQRLPSLPAPRGAPAGVTVGSHLYVLGGKDRTNTRGDVFRLSEAGGQWRWDSMPPLAPDRAWHAAAAAGTRIVVAGGHRRTTSGLNRYAPESFLGRVEFLDTAQTDAGWRPLADIPGKPRGWAAAAVVRDRFYLFGGIYSPVVQKTARLSETLCLDLNTKTWSRKRDLPFPLCGQDAIAVDGRYIVLIGGNRETGPAKKVEHMQTVLVYDTEMDTFEQMPSRLEHQSDVVRAVAHGDRLYAVTRPAPGAKPARWLHTGSLNWGKEGAPSVAAEPLPKPDKHCAVRDLGVDGFEAFPRVIRLSNGSLLMAFHARPQRQSLGKIACVRSEDNGRTWSDLTIIADTEGDDRNGVLIETDDGTVLCHFHIFRPSTKSAQLQMAVSGDYGKTWRLAADWLSGAPATSGIGAAAIELADGALILPIYTTASGSGTLYRPALLRSQDRGKTWGDLSLIDADTKHRHCEPALVVLPDRRWLCLMRPCMCRCYSSDQGRTWTKPERVGFKGDCPCLLRTSTGGILCAHRHPGTSLSYSLDSGAHWVGPVSIDPCKGAYPSMVELQDGSVLCVFHDGGDTSDIWSVRFRATDRGITWLAR